MQIVIHIDERIVALGRRLVSRRGLCGMLAVACLSSTVVYAVSVPNRFAAGTPISAAAVNANFAALEAAAWSANPQGDRYHLGTVGIGTATPGEAKLEVAGELKVSGGTLANAGSGLRLGDDPRLGYKWVQSFDRQTLALNPLGNSVGIGTTGKDVAGEVHQALIKNAQNGRVLALDGAGWSGLWWAVAGTPRAALDVTDGGAMTFWTNSGSWAQRAVISGSGNLGVGTDQPSSRLHVAGGCISGSMCSDARLKDHLQRYDEPVLDRLVQLEAKSFTWKDRPADGPRVGVVAQDVEAVFPEVVTTGERGEQKGIDCTGLQALTIEAIKELEARNDALQAELAELRRMIAAHRR